MLSVMLLSMLMILLSALSVIRHLTFDNNYGRLLNLNLTWQTLDWCMKWLVDLTAVKTQPALFDGSNNNGTIDAQVNGSALKEKLTFKMLGLSFCSNLKRGSYIVSIATTASKKMEPWLDLWSFFCFISADLPFSLIWNAVLMSGWCS